MAVPSTVSDRSDVVRMVLDCDPGHDDAVALFMALASPAVSVELVTTCAGNQRPEKTFANARRLLALAGREDIPVVQGSPRPLRRELIIADYVHGESGIDGAELPEATVEPDGRRAVEAIAQLVESSDEPITLVATGPLTNIAIFLLAYPDLRDRIAQISIMGGACFGGNYSAAAEFNIYVDPEAADIVFNAGVPIAMFGLDVTHKAQIFTPEIEAIRDLGTRTGEVFAGLLEFYDRSTTRPFLAPDDHVEGLHMHDPCAVAYLIDPSLFTMVATRVDIVTSDGPTLGATVVDYNASSGREPNALVGFDIDRDRFAHLLHTSLASFA
ncbi:nucleoside hydrolase [Agromyces atrinae]|uniref:nucleoside hydrolase n=1 Tax=Agromyces atrinae TaxID=592376 RepID=UPI001F59CAFB|nr:nucleoside hydrolase [Agromyces atrinae]MCI2958722.1 nucleoside hydrolase [Agromyces atrinae]